MFRRHFYLLSFPLLLSGIISWLWLSLFAANAALPAEQTRPARIASLTLATDEILSELVAPERVACVTFFVDDASISNVPDRFPKRIPRLRTTDPERILGLNPDLVCVAPYNTADFLKVMERSGLPIYRHDAFSGMNEIETGILDLGKRVGEPDRAQEIVKQMRDRRRNLAERLGGMKHKPRILSWSAGFTMGRRTTTDDIIREAGGTNVAVERNLNGLAEISPEIVIAADPDYILQSRWSTDEPEGRIEKHPLLRNLRAVREKKVIAIEGRYLSSVSQFVVEGAERLARELHPDRFAAPTPAAAPSVPSRKP